MSKPEPRANRHQLRDCHQLRVWMKWAIELGLLGKVPTRYDPGSSDDPEPTEDYARRLLAELKDPDSSRRIFDEILADARRFRDWVESRQKASPRMILGHWDSKGAAARVPEPRLPTRPDREERPARLDRDGLEPNSDPMWDDWLDG